MKYPFYDFPKLGFFVISVHSKWIQFTKVVCQERFIMPFEFPADESWWRNLLATINSEVRLMFLGGTSGQ